MNRRISEQYELQLMKITAICPARLFSTLPMSPAYRFCLKMEK
jgi:hypothetical protein